MSTELLNTLLFPHALERTARVRQANGRFVYYTTAATAFQILKNREIWMRSTKTMNDFMEVEHGVDCVLEALSRSGGDRLRSATDLVEPGLFAEIEALYRNWIPGFQSDTFVTCVSEHETSEDQYGRLSMWRAYGGSTGVALVFNSDVFFLESDALAAYSSPVGYMQADDVERQMGLIAEGISKNTEALRAIDRADIQSTFFHMLRFGTVCTKHPGFAEEKEWRIVSSPTLQASNHLKSEVEVIGGIPQVVLKIPLVDVPEEGLVGLEVPKLLDRVLIGPTEYPGVIRSALKQVLAAAGVTDPGDRIVTSSIPLREVQK